MTSATRHALVRSLAALAPPVVEGAVAAVRPSRDGTCRDTTPTLSGMPDGLGVKSKPWQQPVRLADLQAAAARANQRFATKGHLRSARLGASLVALNGRQQFVGSSTGTLAVDADNEAYLGYLGTGVPLSITFAVSERPRPVKVVVSAYGSDRIGAVSLPVK